GGGGPNRSCIGRAEADSRSGSGEGTRREKGGAHGVRGHREDGIRGGASNVGSPRERGLQAGDDRGVHSTRAGNRDGASGEVIWMATKRKNASPTRKSVRSENGSHMITVAVNGRKFTRAGEPRVLLVASVPDQPRLRRSHL